MCFRNLNFNRKKKKKKLKYNGFALFSLDASNLKCLQVQSLTPSRIQNSGTSKLAPLTPAQRTAWAERHNKIQAEINDIINEWMKSTLNTASKLAHQFVKKEHYFLDIFFQGGAHLVHKKTKVNAYNAFKHLKAEELRDNETLYIYCDSSSRT